MMRHDRDQGERQNGEHLAASTLLAAAAIIAAEADERGIRHWTDLADRLTAEAARIALKHEEETDE